MQPDLRRRTRSPFWDSIVFTVPSPLVKPYCTVYTCVSVLEMTDNLRFKIWEKVSWKYKFCLLISVVVIPVNWALQGSCLGGGSIHFVCCYLNTEITLKLLVLQSIKSGMYEFKELYLLKYLIAVSGNINLNLSVVYKRNCCSVLLQHPQVLSCSLVFLGITCDQFTSMCNLSSGDLVLGELKVLTWKASRFFHGHTLPNDGSLAETQINIRVLFPS